MQRTTFTIAVVRYPKPRRPEIVSRAGHLEPHATARQIEQASGGQVVAVRHERVMPNGSRRQTVAAFNMGGA
jgi:hypothetical protein